MSLIVQPACCGEPFDLDDKQIWGWVDAIWWEKQRGTISGRLHLYADGEYVYLDYLETKERDTYDWEEVDDEEWDGDPRFDCPMCGAEICADDLVVLDEAQVELNEDTGELELVTTESEIDGAGGLDPLAQLFSELVAKKE